MESDVRYGGSAERAIDVLVVEDEPDFRALMCVLLRKNDCSVRAVATVAAAHECALERAPDVVVTDLELREGGAGWMLAHTLRVDPRTRAVALIAMSGRVEPRVEVVRPFDAYVRKPLDVDLLLVLVTQLAAVSRAARRRALMS